MKSTADQSNKNSRSRAVANRGPETRSGNDAVFDFVDNRPEAIQLRKLQEMADNSPRTKRSARFQAMADNSSSSVAVRQSTSGVAAQFQQVPEEEELKMKAEAEPIRRQAVEEGDPNKSPVQRDVLKHQDKTGNADMSTIAKKLSDAVDQAKGIVDSNPLLTGQKVPDGGYLALWRDTFNEFLSTGAIPQFFYARYGYAVETIATDIFRASSYSPYIVVVQATYGATRPDVVIQDAEKRDVAWLDITSAASQGHIFQKTGSGWISRPYVAEILYDMPKPSDFTTTATGLTADQKAALGQADAAAALREQQFDTGMKAVGALLENSLAAARVAKGEGAVLSRQDIRNVTISLCRKLMSGTPPRVAAGVLASIDLLNVEGNVRTGELWYREAHFDAVDRLVGRGFLMNYGANLMGTAQDSDETDAAVGSVPATGAVDPDAAQT